ncbi:hypothetical protein [Nocardia sp. XZ_19_231]|uniref:hypothetical protein n=1 Tax=Nocardia sp. XZ_19_231 TaxID=2769252 RepID=UPI00188FE424|nr:hypothetical protein [Nocardia sp. XZ_19_231]
MQGPFGHVRRQIFSCERNEFLRDAEPCGGGDCRAGSAPLLETEDGLRTAVAQLVVDYYALAYAADGDKPALSVAVN